MSGERKRYIDLIKGIGIILVIMGHVNFANAFVKDWIYLFHMPLFFFSTGLVTRQQLNRDFIIKKIWTLMVPYVLWGLIYAELTIPNIAKIAYGSYKTIISASSLSSLWFLPAMFISTIAVQCILRMTNKPMWQFFWGGGSLVVGILLPTFNYGYPWCLDIALITTFFIIIGYVAKDKLEAINWKLSIITLIIGMSITLIAVKLSSQSVEYILLASRRMGNPIVFVVGSLGGCLMIYSLARIIDYFVPHTEMLSYLGRNSLTIFLVHKPVIWGFEKVFNIIPLTPMIELFITTAVSLACSCIMAWVINKYFPVLIGKTGVTSQKKDVLHSQ